MNNVHTISLADTLAALQKSYGQQHSFGSLNVFLCDICVGHQLADLACQLMEWVGIYLLLQSTISKFTTMNT